jgi:hypothetical protein
MWLIRIKRADALARPKIREFTWIVYTPHNNIQHRAMQSQ